MAPSWTDVVESERLIMTFLGWDLGWVLPLHYVEIFLANGVLFSGEPKTVPKSKETAQQLSKKSYSLLDEMISQNKSFKNQGYSANQVASAVIYTSRKEVLGLNKSSQIWPKELQIITRLTALQAKKLAKSFKDMLHPKIEAFDDHVFSINNTDSKLQREVASAANFILDLTKAHQQQDPTFMSPGPSQKFNFYKYPETERSSEVDSRRLVNHRVQQFIVPSGVPKNKKVVSSAKDMKQISDRKSGKKVLQPSATTFSLKQGIPEKRVSQFRTKVLSSTKAIDCFKLQIKNN